MEMLKPTTLSSDMKARLEPVLKPEYMSSDESLTTGDSDSDNQLATPGSRHKYLRKHQLSAHGEVNFEECITSLDRKRERRTVAF